MPNYKAEYTLEMILDLIEANLHQEGFELGNTPITFNLSEFDKETLILDIVKADRNAIPSFLNTSDYVQDVRLELNAPTPTVEPAPAPAEEPATGKGKRKYTKPVLSEKELARRAKLSVSMTKLRAEQKAAKEAKKIEGTTPATEPLPARLPDPEPHQHNFFTYPVKTFSDPSDVDHKHYHKVCKSCGENEFLDCLTCKMRQEFQDKVQAEIKVLKEVVAPAALTFPGARQ